MFERSDVYAQLLRLRLFAHELGAVPLDVESAAHEAEMAAGFQSPANEAALSGGFWFGRKGSQLLPYMNPVSTAFCAQALTMWRRFKDGDLHTPLDALV